MVASSHARMPTLRCDSYKVSDIDYYFTSRLPGDPLKGVVDIHTHPTVPRTVRMTLALGL